jgi:hypothetical protein
LVEHGWGDLRLSTLAANEELCAGGKRVGCSPFEFNCVRFGDDNANVGRWIKPVARSEDRDCTLTGPAARVSAFKAYGTATSLEVLEPAILRLPHNTRLRHPEFNQIVNSFTAFSYVRPKIKTGTTARL